MSINLVRWEQQTVTPKHDSIQWDDGRCGVLNGCAITSLGANKLRLEAGYLVILGRLIEVEQTDVDANVSASGEVNGQLFIRLDLGSTTPVELITEAAATLTPLTQEKNANYTNGIYEMQLATYKITETTISGLTKTVSDISPIGSAVEEINNNLKRFSEYSTDEQIIGKWIDNSVIYRKVYTNTQKQSPAPHDLVLDSNFKPSLYKIISLKCMAWWGGYSNNASFSYNDNCVPYSLSPRCDNEKGLFIRYMGTSTSCFDTDEIIVIVEYIKK